MLHSYGAYWIHHLCFCFSTLHYLYSAFSNYQIWQLQICITLRGVHTQQTHQKLTIEMFHSQRYIHNTEGPRLTRFLGLGKTVLHETRVSGTVLITLFESENERQKIEPVPILLPRDSRHFPDVKTRNENFFHNWTSEIIPFIRFGMQMDGT